MYTDHFNIVKPPFANVHDPHFLVLSQDHQKALASLLHAARQREGWVLLSGRSGGGKTTLLTALMMKLPNDLVCAVITDPKLNLLDFFNLLSLELGITGPFADRDEFLAAFRQYLIECENSLKSILLMVDEAQSADHELFEGLKLLDSQAEGPNKTLNIILAAQPEFLDMIKASNLNWVSQRLRSIHYLKPLTESETGFYIRHRTSAAGSTNDLFDAKAVQAVHLISQGNCGLINLICDQAMQLAFEKNLPSVTREQVILAAEHIPGIELSPDNFKHVNTESSEKADAVTLPKDEAVDIASGLPDAVLVPAPAAALKTGNLKPSGDMSRYRPKDDFEYQAFETEAYGVDPPGHKPSLFRRTAGAVFSFKGMAVAASLILIAGIAFFSLGGMRYAKMAYRKYKQESYVLVPEDSAFKGNRQPQIQENPKKKGPPDWGPTLYTPSNSARAQGGGHG